MAKLILGVYDTHDNDVCVTIGTSEEVAQALGIVRTYVSTILQQGTKVKKRYKIERIGKDVDLWEEESNVHRIDSRIDVELNDRLQAQKKREQRSMSDIIRQALDEYLEVE